MSKEEFCKNIIAETEQELRKIQLLPENLFYVTIYRDACTLAGSGQYELAIDICGSLKKHLGMLHS